MKKFFLWGILFVVLTIVSGTFGVTLSAALLSRLPAWSWTKNLPLPPSSSDLTAVERSEPVAFPQEEGLERFIASPRSATVSIVSVPSEKAARTLARMATDEMSGVLVTNDGVVATYANEVPLTANRRFTVFFSDGNASQAEFLAYDSVMNVAYFRTERADTPAISFANSLDVRSGRRFIALSGLSNPEEGTLSSGYIGARDRAFNLSGKTVASTDEWEGVFLPDRPLDADFTGAAAVAINGELIGLIGTIQLDGRERAFILPANALRQSLQRIIVDAGAGHANFGAYYVTLTKETGLLHGVSRDRGALIFTPSENPGLAVIDGSLAERSGLRYGDIVTAVNGREINLDWPFSVALYEAAADAPLVLTVLREGNGITLSLPR